LGEGEEGEGGGKTGGESGRNKGSIWYKSHPFSFINSNKDKGRGEKGGGKKGGGGRGGKRGKRFIALRIY